MPLKNQKKIKYHDANKLRIYIYAQAYFHKFDSDVFPRAQAISSLEARSCCLKKSRAHQDNESHLPAKARNHSERMKPKKIMRKYNAKPSQLPYIMSSDKAIEDLDVRPGDVIKITRKSPTAGESVYYRYVVEG